MSSILVLGLLVASCGFEPGAALPDTSTTTVPTSTTTTSTTTTTTVPTTTTLPTTTTTLPTTTTTIPGEPTDIGPRAGDILMVAGVRYDDHLNLRAAPGATQPIIGTISPTEMDLEAVGETRVLSGTYWIKVVHEGKTGWVHLGYVGYAGQVDDMTSVVVAALQQYPTAPTMQDLGPIVAAVFVSDDPEANSRVVRVTAGTGGNLGEIIYDVIGLADDAVGGLRLHIFAEKGSDGYSFRTVEAMLICRRGVASGACT